MERGRGERSGRAVRSRGAFGSNQSSGFVEFKGIAGRKSGLGAAAFFDATGRAHKRSGDQAGAEWRLAGLVTTLAQQI